MIVTIKQLQIISATGKILSNRGVSGLTTKTLAKEMGCVESALYRHFKSKEDILILMIKYLHHNIEGRLDIITKSTLNPIEKIKAIFESQFHFLNENRHFVIAMMSEGLLDDSDEIKNEAIQIFKYKSNILKNLLEESVKSKQIIPLISTDAMLHFLVSAFRTLIYKWKMINFEFDIEKEGAQMIKDYLTLVTQKSK